MSTYMANPQNVERSWYVIDAAGKTLGKVAVEAAVLLRGKHKVTYTPHVDCGDNVIIVNASQIVLTGKKADQKMYYHHTGFIGHMKSVKYSTLLKSKPVFVVEKAVRACFPPTPSAEPPSAVCTYMQAPSISMRPRSPKQERSEEGEEQNVRR